MRKHYDNRIELDGYMRGLLLAEICRRENVISAANMDLDLELEQVRGNDYLGTCPWCGQPGFTLNKRSGACSCKACKACGESGDYLDLLCLYRDENLAAALGYLSALLKSYAASETRRRAKKRAAGRRLHESAGGAA